MGQISHRQRLREKGLLKKAEPGLDLSFQPGAVVERVTIAQQEEMATRHLRAAAGEAPQPFEEPPPPPPVAPALVEETHDAVVTDEVPQVAPPPTPPPVAPPVLEEPTAEPETTETEEM